MSDRLNSYLKENSDRFLEELISFLKIPSISTDSNSKADVDRCAHWLKDHLFNIGITNVQLEETPGHPIIYAEYLIDASKPTILLYGHYDVQPPEPLDLWDSPPFEPTIRDGKIFARGATDDKGQLFTHIKALEAHLAVEGTLPVNVKILIEGEEEVGSPNLEPWIKDNKEKLSCDAVIISDSSMYAPGIPSIMYGLRGLAYFEIEVEGPSHDLHSGLYGGAVPNPINVLSSIISSFHDADGRIAIDGFYDTVRDLVESEREEWKNLPFRDSEFLAETGASELAGEPGFTTLERVWARPTLDCNGIIGGFTGEGAKTVLPSLAKAKFSCRLVPDQDPLEIEKLVIAHIEKVCPSSVKFKVGQHHGGKPVITDKTGIAVDAAKRALKKSWDAEPVFIRGGGSIPVVATFAEVLKTPTVLVGLGLNDDRLHSPNEKFDLENFYKGIQTSAYFWNEV